jgi:hypothetical protein
MLASADVSLVQRMHGQSAPVQEPSRAAVVRGLRRLGVTPTVVWFLAGIKRESCPTQDGPEGRACFQYKMSLRDKAC